MSQATAAAAPPRTLFGHPLGLYTLFSAELWERFSFYGMRALLILYMTDYFVWSQQKASDLFGWYVALAYATPALGGLIADRWLGAKRAVIVGGVLLSIGHFLMAFEPLAFFYTALGFIVLGVGFLKPNISTQVGSLYKADDPRRDGAFTIFYMGINLGAFMGPIVCGWLRINYGFHYGFAAAGVGMILGLIVYIMGHRMLVEFQQQPDEQGRRSAKVTIEVRSDNQPVYFTGTRALEVRPGFVSLEIPPLEKWSELQTRLSRDQRERFEEPEFYELLRREVAVRLRTLSALKA